MTKSQLLRNFAIVGIIFKVVFFTPALAASKSESKTEVSQKNIKSISLIINRVVVDSSTKTVNIDVKIGASLSDVRKQKELERIRLEQIRIERAKQQAEQAEQAKIAKTRSLSVYRIDSSASSGN